jgi:hypothetical protein
MDKQLTIAMVLLKAGLVASSKGISIDIGRCIVEEARPCFIKIEVLL